MLFYNRFPGRLVFPGGLTYEGIFGDIPKETLREIIEYLDSHEWIFKTPFSEGKAMYVLDETEALADNRLSIDFGDPSSLRALGRTTVASQVPFPFSKIDKSVVNVADKRFKTEIFTMELAQEWFDAINVSMNILGNVMNLVHSNIQEEMENGLISSYSGLVNNIKAEYYELAELVSKFFGSIEKVVKSKFADRVESQEVLEYVKKELLEYAADFELEAHITEEETLYFKIPKIRQYKRTFGRLGKSKEKPK